MTIRSRIKKLEALPVRRHAFMDSMEEITPEEAENAYNKIMNGPSSPFFAIISKGRIPLQDLSEAEFIWIYKECADLNPVIVTT